MIVLLLVACVQPEPADSAPPEDTGVPAVDTGSPWWEAPAGDADGDGAGADDCDDADPLRHPGAGEVCDGRDNDCDGVVDDLAPPDPFEPDDDEATWLGDLTETPMTLLSAFLHPATDEDRFQLYVEDPYTSWFSLEVWLYDVPAEADLALALWWLPADGSGWELVGTSDETGLGGYEVVDWDGGAGTDDAGSYEVVVSSVQGSGCAAPYGLHLVVGSW